MDSPCIKQTVCKVLKVFQYGKYLVSYVLNVLQQTACLVVNPITVGNFAFLFNCTPVGRTSDSMMVPTYLLMRLWGPDALAVCRAHRDLPVGFLLLRYSV